MRFLQASRDADTIDIGSGVPSTVTSRITIKAREVSEDKKDLYLIVAVAQEHKLGRWYKKKEAKNSVKIIKLSP